MSRTVLGPAQREAAYAALHDDWWERADCRRPGAAAALAVNARDHGDLAVQTALAVCHACPVLNDCRAWTMARPRADDPGGVCGGLTEAERTEKRRARTRAKQKAAARRKAARATERAA